MRNKVVSFIGITPSQNFLGGAGSEIYSALYIGEDVSYSSYYSITVSN